MKTVRRLIGLCILAIGALCWVGNASCAATPTDVRFTPKRTLSDECRCLPSAEPRPQTYQRPLVRRLAQRLTPCTEIPPKHRPENHYGSVALFGCGAC
jgi:hypothetical protein